MTGQAARKELTRRDLLSLIGASAVGTGVIVGLSWLPPHDPVDRYWAQTHAADGTFIQGTGRRTIEDAESDFGDIVTASFDRSERPSKKERRKRVTLADATRKVWAEKGEAIRAENPDATVEQIVQLLMPFLSALIGVPVLDWIIARVATWIITAVLRRLGVV